MITPLDESTMQMLVMLFIVHHYFTLFYLLLLYANDFVGIYDFQGISIMSPHPGVVRVNGYFIQGSTTTGVLIALLTAAEIYFRLLTRKGNQQYLEGTISNVADGDHYYVSVLVVEADLDGLSFNKTATIPQIVSVVKGLNYLIKNGSATCVTIIMCTCRQWKPGPIIFH